MLSDGGPRHQKIVQLLIDHAADVTIADKDGVTPLQHARKRGFAEIARILAQAEAAEDSSRIIFHFPTVKNAKMPYCSIFLAPLALLAVEKMCFDAPVEGTSRAGTHT